MSFWHLAMLLRFNKKNSKIFNLASKQSREEVKIFKNNMSLRFPKAILLTEFFSNNIHSACLIADLWASFKHLSSLHHINSVKLFTGNSAVARLRDILKGWGPGDPPNKCGAFQIASNPDCLFNSASDQNMYKFIFERSQCF